MTDLLRRLLVIVFLSVPGFNKLNAQLRTLYPDDFLVFSNSMHLVNPAYIPEKGSLNIGANYKAKTMVGDVSTFEAHGEKVFRKKNDRSHLLRIYLFNEKEGPYISYPKLFGNYALGLPLSASTSLYAGFSLGVSRINFSAPSGSGSATALDASLGLAIRRKNLYLGAGTFQLMNNEAIAISVPLFFARYYLFHLEWKKSILNQWSGKIYGLYRYLPLVKNQMNAGVSLLYANFFETGAIYRVNRGVSSFGTFRFNSDDHPFSITFAYNFTLFTPLGRSYEFYEISLNYTIK